MSKPTTREKIKFVMSCYAMTPKWKDTIFQELMPVLKEKIPKKNV